MAAALLAAAADAPPAVATPPQASTLAGDWSGTLPFLPPKRVILHVRRAGEEVRASLDVPDLGVQGVPIAGLTRDGASVVFAIPAADVRFEGELQPGGRELRGTFTDHGLAQPLILAFTASDAPPPPFKAAGPAGPWRTPSTEQIRRILKAEVAARQALGLVVGVIGPDGGMVVSEGVSDPSDPRPLGADTPFPIESVTKTFTVLLLADMVVRGQVKLDDPLQAYLPPEVRVPEFDGRKITLKDLATHTSGLPRTPFDYAPGYGSDRIFRFLSSYRLTRAPGARWEYSNLGSALLADALARRGGQPFEALVKARITDPLGMSSTTWSPDPQLRARVPRGHNSGLQPVEEEAVGGFGGAVGLYSTADDLLKYLAFELGYARTPLDRAAELARSVRVPIAPDADQALGWEIEHIGPPGAEVFAKSGGSNGFRAYAAFRPDTRTGVVVLSNASTAASPDDIGLYVLTGRPIPPLQPAPARTAAPEVAVPAATLAGYVGRYRLTPQATIAITRQGGRLFGQMVNSGVGGPLIELFATSPTHFFAKAVNAQVDLAPGPDGRATGLHLVLNGAAMTAERMGD